MLGSTVALSVSTRLPSVVLGEAEEEVVAMVGAVVATTLVAEEATEVEVGIVCSYHPVTSVYPS